MSHGAHRPLLGWAAALAVLAIAMAGCSGPGAANKASDNAAPHAVLSASRNTGWTTDTFTFDGSKSTDSDGRIVQYIFDFGDHTPPTTVQSDESVSHAFSEGGEYTVTLTVMDDGAHNTGAKSDMTTKTVAVDQRFNVPTGAIYAGPTQNDTTAKYREPFKVQKDADRIHVDLAFQSAAIGGGSRIEVRLLDENEKELERQEYTLDANQNRTFTLDQNTVSDQGTYFVEILAHSGGGTYDGHTDVYYDRGYSS